MHTFQVHKLARLYILSAQPCISTSTNSLQLRRWLKKRADLADGLLSLLLNSRKQDLASWDILDKTNDLTSSPNLYSD